LSIIIDNRQFNSSAPNAMEYYPKIGFEKIENGFIIRRGR
jgi:hypothetical protein